MGNEYLTNFNLKKDLVKLQKFKICAISVLWNLQLKM